MGLRPLGHPWLKPVRSPVTPNSGTGAFAHDPGEPHPQAGTACSATVGRHRLLPDVGRRGPRSGRGPGPCRRHRAGPFPLPMPRRNGLSTWRSPWAISIAASNGRWSAGPTRAPSTMPRRWPATRTVGHATAYCRAVEALTATRVPARGQFLRGIALELERVANHIGDLGALAGDVGFLPTVSYCGRIRGDVLNMPRPCSAATASAGAWSGRAAWLSISMPRVSRATAAAIGRHRPRCPLRRGTALELALGDGPLRRYRHGPPEVCQQLGLVGVAARACGTARDVRRDFPTASTASPIFPSPRGTPAMFSPGRYVRWLEVQRSLAFLGRATRAMPGGPVIARGRPARPPIRRP